MIPDSVATKKYRDPVFDEIVLHEPFGPIEELIDDFTIKKFTFSVDDYKSWVLVRLGL